MKYDEFGELTNLSDNDILLIQEASTLGIKKVKLLTLKQYIGIAAASTSVNSNPPNGYVKWYRASDVIANNNTVTTVLDKAPSKNDLIPFSGNPTLVPNAVNNKPALNFNNAALKHNPENYAAKNSFVIYRNRVANYNDYNAYICARPNFSDKVPVSNEYLIISGTESKPNIYSEGATKGYIDNIEQNIIVFKDYNQGVNAGSINQFHIIESLNTNSVSTTKNLCVGADSYGSGRYLQNTDIAEIIIYPNILNSQERSDIYKYFNSYYGFNL